MISKQARAFVRGWLLGLSKKAAPIQPAAKPAQPLAYVGIHNSRNKYLEQLANNYVKAGGSQTDADTYVRHPTWQFGVMASNKPITQSDLNAQRSFTSRLNASLLFNPYTKQHAAYKDWLIRRGAENQKFFQQNDLQHDPKSSIPLPPILQKEPAEIQKKMIIEGKGKAHNNTYNKFRNGIPS